MLSVTYVYAKFGDDRLGNEKALGDRKSDNNNNKSTTTILQEQEQRSWPSGRGPVSGSKNFSSRNVARECITHELKLKLKFVRNLETTLPESPSMR